MTFDFAEIEQKKVLWKDSLIIKGDSREMVKKLPNNFYSCCVTSPPYWGKRDYGYNGQIGAENEMDQYIKNLVSIFNVIKIN
ncbi:MAG: hypothetical protein R2759_00715 [Bacteroidales bacterium]